MNENKYKAYWSLEERGSSFNMIKHVKGIAMDVNIEYFEACDIETLREKLIEDIMKLVAHKIPLKEVEDIINKRFGVE